MSSYSQTMTMGAKTDANRRNALRSTGPKTQRGKAASKLNALRHGLTAETAVLPDENADAYVELRRRLHEELGAESMIEAAIVDRVAGLLWRLRRLGRVELDLFEWEREMAAVYCSLMGKSEEPEQGLGLAFIHSAGHSDAFSRLSRYETALDRALYRAVHELERLQAARRGQPVAPPLAVDVNVSADGR
jgi:trehalose utilization protein